MPRFFIVPLTGASLRWAAATTWLARLGQGAALTLLVGFVALLMPLDTLADWGVDPEWIVALMLSALGVWGALLMGERWCRAQRRRAVAHQLLAAPAGDGVGPLPWQLAWATDVALPLPRVSRYHLGLLRIGAWLTAGGILLFSITGRDPRRVGAALVVAAALVALVGWSRRVVAARHRASADDAAALQARFPSATVASPAQDPTVGGRGSAAASGRIARVEAWAWATMLVAWLLAIGVRVLAPATSGAPLVVSVIAIAATVVPVALARHRQAAWLHTAARQAAGEQPLSADDVQAALGDPDVQPATGRSPGFVAGALLPLALGALLPVAPAGWSDPLPRLLLLVGAAMAVAGAYPRARQAHRDANARTDAVLQRLAR